MKKIMTLLLTLITFNSTSALEIQCDSIWDDILVVLKKSPSTNVSYLLFLGEKELEKYYVIQEENYIFTKDFFTFKDEATSITVDLLKAEGEILSANPLFRGEGMLPLDNCKDFDN